ncbi:ElaB/YqjD/DUF883 family membrane-anchored ribosome-binding protein [Azospirillum fermentarium]|uniref:hypothetical protein n=1 Tax=Azospirillum fermentarium TaxID=1233114 RepID=UPI00222663D6|nr:hypothetical protein [Azospirillum fermentarium]MCW2248312.1 ElaB/YqjD/DUF883 family membrane-anchored ribosome-binding protein [Azospirillum fermentarium]
MQDTVQGAGGIVENLIPTILDGGHKGTIAVLLVVLLAAYFTAKKAAALVWGQVIAPHLPQNARPPDPSAAVVAEIRALDAKVADALRQHAEASSEGRRRLYERIDAMDQQNDQRFGRIEQRIDDGVKTYATRAEVEAQIKPLQTVCEHAIDEAGRLVSELRRMVGFTLTRGGTDAAPD